jgi:Domain of unknown function (DUF4276)
VRYDRGKRIVLLCEGDTEELVVKHLISRQWQQDGLESIGLHPVNLNAKLQDAPVKARLYLDEPEVLSVFTLVDLYGMDRVRHQGGDSLDERVARVQAWFSDGLVHPRAGDFLPHVCVHESEAWLLAEGVALAKRLGDSAIGPDPQAELKNFQLPPQRRINDLFMRHKGERYQKIRDGRPLFAAVQFEPIYHTCRFFRAFYDDLKRIATKA